MHNNYHQVFENLPFMHNWWLLQENIDNLTINQKKWIIHIDNLTNTKKNLKNLPNNYEKSITNQHYSPPPPKCCQILCVKVVTTSIKMLPNFVHNVGCHLHQNVTQFCV
jgi:hypothetical protein